MLKILAERTEEVASSAEEQLASMEEMIKGHISSPLGKAKFF